MLFYACLLAVSVIGLSNGQQQQPIPVGTSAIGCLPNIPIVSSIKPEQRTGNWYNYLFYGNHPFRANDWYNQVPLGRAVLPGTTTSALVTSTVISWWTSTGPDATCAGQFVQMYITDDGREVMVLYSSDSPNPISLTSYALYDDYKFMQIRYFCTKPNPVTKLCLESNFFVNTRQRPDTLSQADLNRVRDIADRVLAQYCISTAVFKHETWIASQPPCNVVTSQCYNDLIHGLAVQINPAPTSP